MISHTYKCIFVHIPKCGGSSLENIIWPEQRDTSNLWMGFISKYQNKYQTGGLQHLLATQIRQEVGEGIFNQYFKFTIIRNPWDKMVSQYSYMKHRPDLREFIGMNENDSFKTYLKLIKKKVHVQWEPQYKFVLNDNGDVIVDYIGRLENFDYHASQILAQLKIKAEIPHVNASSHRHYSAYYDEEAMDTVVDLYGEDIRIFGYSFT